MNAWASLSLVCASVLVTGCVTRSYDKPFLTPQAFAHAAATCHVVSEGVHHARGSDVPFANYLVPAANGEARSDGGRSRACLERALRNYRYDFLGEEFPKTTP